MDRSDAAPPPSPGAATTIHVRHAIDGSHDSVAWLVARLSPVLMEAAHYRLGPALRAHCDPEDLVHEAWLVTLPRLRELRARDGRYTPVLLRFLTTTVLLRVRNLAKRSARAAPVREPELLQDEHTGVVSRAIRDEQQGEVRRALTELASGDREVVLLRGIEQRSTRATAEVLGISEDAVSKRYQRALERLRQRVPGSVFDELDD